MNIKTEIEESDYKELDLKCGLEIHQQLEGKKLFCNCPTLIRNDKPDFEVIRYLRASAGESGKVDVAALAETKKQKYFVYEGYNDTTCLVELDEEPPGEVNNDALTAALQIAKLTNMSIVDQLRFMRKIVVNGSNTSGFQRTALVATSGTITIENGKIFGVETLSLEEDSCKDIEKAIDYTKYNLSRLGIPLLELATAPDITTPDEAQDVAQYIGMLMRSLPNVKRGIGTIRQDVNISIAKGVRVEIKGAQDLKILPSLLRFELLRQHNLLEIFAELKNRRAMVGKEIIDVTKIFTQSESKVIKTALEKKHGVVLAVPLFNFGGLTEIEIQPGRRYGSELSDYAKVMGVKGLFHADELPHYGITAEEKEKVFSELKLDSAKDNFLLIADTKAIAIRALRNAQERAADFNLRKEVRTAKPDGTSIFMRPMPGAARMYPETDVKPIILHADAVAVPKLLSSKEKELENLGLSKDYSKKILKIVPNFKEITERFPKIKPSTLVDFEFSGYGQIIESLPKATKTFVHSVEEFRNPLGSEFILQEFLPRLNDGKITNSSLASSVVEYITEGKVDWSKYELLDIKDIEDEIKKIISEMKSAPMGAIIGKVMGKYKGKINGKELSSFVAKLLE